MSSELRNRNPLVSKKSSNCDCCNADSKSDSGWGWYLEMGVYRYRLNMPKWMEKSFLVLFGISLCVVYVLNGLSPVRKSPSSPQVTSLSVARRTVGNCELRKYPKRRYYGLGDRPLPGFLETEYIYGELPRILKPIQAKPKNSGSGATKLCVDQSEWYNKKKSENSTPSITPLPFADGTNPSILKLLGNQRIDPSIREVLGTIGGASNTSPHYLATICMTDSQCSWNDSPEDIIEFRLSNDKQPSTVRTVLLVLDENFQTLAEATIHTRIDAKFGGRFQPNNQIKTFKLDDARLFTHKGQIWVSYREGKIFGYDKQVLNKLHFGFEKTTVGDSTASAKADADTKRLRTTSNTKQHLTVTLLASDTETLCCGRNMALLDNVHTGQLQALTWADPVTVEDVDVSRTDGAASGSDTKQQHRRLDAKKGGKKKSHFHGTNAFMVHLPKTGEYLGIGHFHRPPDRKKNDYARFGHHYTHAFFTITEKPPFRLKRLSPELVLPSESNPVDAEIIQFWSGLDLSTGFNGEDDARLVLAYGINDCEGAATHLDLSLVESLLREVPEGKEVVDLMMELK